MKTFTNLLEEFLNHARSLNYSRYTLRAYSCNLNVFLGWLEQTYDVRTVERLQKKHLHAWTQHLNEHRTTRGLPLKPSSVNAFNGNIRGFLKYLIAQGYLQRTYAEELPTIKAPQMLPSSVLTHTQIKKLLAKVNTQTAEGYRDRAMLELLYSSGVRVAELLGLNVLDIDRDNAMAIVIGKGKKQRMVPIGKTALRYLESYLVAVRPFLLCDASEQALFLTSEGVRMPYHRFLQSVHRHAQASGLEITVTPHTFRRSCATELIRGGANMYHIKELLGHESLSTLRHYSKLTITDLKKTHEKCHPREGDRK